MNLLAEVRKAFEPALAAVGADPAKVPEYLDMVKPASNPDHGDYQANFAMPLAKVKGVKPHDLADQLIVVLHRLAIDRHDQIVRPKAGTFAG